MKQCLFSSFVHFGSFDFDEVKTLKVFVIGCYYTTLHFHNHLKPSQTRTAAIGSHILLGLISSSSAAPSTDSQAASQVMNLPTFFKSHFFGCEMKRYLLVQ